ncbi:MAG: HAD-IA family hydrolase [Mariprofundales bacterium]
MINKHNDAILFDLDGTLIDGFAPIVNALNKTLLDFGHKPMSANEIRRNTGRGDHIIAKPFGKDWPEAHKLFLQYYDEYTGDINILPDAKWLLEQLQAMQIPMAIVTNKNEQRAKRQLDKLGWSQFFNCIIGATSSRLAKPDPFPVLLCCRNLHVSPQNCCFLGDGLSDMQAAKAANIGTVIGITSTFDAADLYKTGAQYCIANLRELLDSRLI